jgi:negative regulator of sigma E activity
MNDTDAKAFEERSRALFADSVDGLDMRMRSRLTQARHAALAAAEPAPWFRRWAVWTPAVAVTAAVVLGVALWLGHPADGGMNLEDLDLVAASDQGPGDAVEMLQDDLDFYDFADSADSAGPAA